jgi:hypothetical protein
LNNGWPHVDWWDKIQTLHGVGKTTSMYKQFLFVFGKLGRVARECPNKHGHMQHMPFLLLIHNQWSRETRMSNINRDCEARP